MSSAMSASTAELKMLAKAAGKVHLEGMGTEFPTLRTAKESELIESGRYGRKGFGFNVLTELKHTAGTMEDQVIISGKLADAITSITKNLVKPAPTGRLKSTAKTSEEITNLKPTVLADTEIQKTFGEIQKVLGVPDVYKGRADKAFIDEVKKALTVLRGEEVEVQQARLTEVFLNYFGRKFFSRYGSKGVAAFPSGLGNQQQNEVISALKQFPDATIKVLSKKERKTAGLGVAILPRSAGEILSELFGKDVSDELKTVVY